MKCEDCKDYIPDPRLKGYGVCIKYKDYDIDPESKEHYYHGFYSMTKGSYDNWFCGPYIDLIRDLAHDHR